MTRRWSLPSSATAGERLFAAYLNQCALEGDFQVSVGDSCLDFTLHLPGGQQLLVEVYEPTEKALPQGGWRKPEYLAAKLFRSNHKAKQFRAAQEAGLPLLCVLAGAGSDFDISPLDIAIAMCGLDAPLRSQKFSEVSAVAVVGSFNPTEQQLDRHLGSYDPEARQAYLALVVNPFANRPFDWNVFEGPHDERWDRTGLPSPEWIGLVWQGPLAHHRPNMPAPINTHNALDSTQPSWGHLLGTGPIP